MYILSNLSRNVFLLCPAQWNTQKKVKNIRAGVSKTMEFYFYSLSNVKNFSANNSYYSYEQQVVYFAVLTEKVGLVHSCAVIYK